MKVKFTFIIGVAFLLAPFMPAGRQVVLAGEVRTAEYLVIGAEAEFEIVVNGTLDPENIEIMIENLGDIPVENPRITVNGKYDWFDAAAIVKEATAGCTTDHEKVMAIWEFVLWKRYQRSPRDLSDLHPVRGLNCYGYGICGHTASWLKCLYTAAGFEARVQEIHGHTVSEVYYDGAWHFIDGNVKVFYAGRDNRTLPSLAELEKDGWLIRRTLHSADPWVRHPDQARPVSEFERYITTAGDNYVETGYDKEIGTDYNMAYTLKPAEKFTRWWKPVLAKYTDRLERPEVPKVYANGRLVWEPDLGKVDVYPYLDIVENITTGIRSGQGPAIQCVELQEESFARPARFSIPVKSPYPIVGGRFYCTLLKEGLSSFDHASIAFGDPPFRNGDLYIHRWTTGLQEAEIDLDGLLMKRDPVYDYKIGFSLSGNAKADPPSRSGVTSFKSVTDVQVSPHSLPALALGQNVIHYRDSSPAAGKKVRLSWKWREIDDNNPPRMAGKAISPADGSPVQSLTPILRWETATDPDKTDKVADYQVLVSLRPDARWPLSPTLYQSLGGPVTEWKVPETFLNPGTTYYWKVRARDSRGVIGQWSEVFSFRTSGSATASKR